MWVQLRSHYYYSHYYYWDHSELRVSQLSRRHIKTPIMSSPPHSLCLSFCPCSLSLYAPSSLLAYLSSLSEISVRSSLIGVERKKPKYYINNVAFFFSLWEKQYDFLFSVSLRLSLCPLSVCCFLFLSILFVSSILTLYQPSTPFCTSCHGGIGTFSVRSRFNPKERLSVHLPLLQYGWRHWPH